MKQSKNRRLYSRHTDESYIREVFTSSVPLEPNDNAVTDAEILSGKLAGTFHGAYSKFEDGLNPLHRRGVDFTDVGNILAVIDAQEERTANDINKRRKELDTNNDDNVQSKDQN